MAMQQGTAKGRPRILSVLRPVLLAAGACLWAVPAAAGDYLEDAPVAYRADVEVQAGGSRYRGRIYHRPGMQRRAFAGQGRYQILRFDKGMARWVDPENRQWWPEPLSAVGLLSRAQLSLVQVGEEMLLGRRARVYKASGMMSSGARIRGQIWVDKSGILLRARLSARAGRRRWTYKMKVISLHVGPQVGSLFTIPAAYRRRGAEPFWSPGRTAVRGGTDKKGHDSRQSLEDLFRR